MTYDDERIKELWQQNCTIGQIADDLGVGRKKLGLHIREMVEADILTRRYTTGFKRDTKREDQIRCAMNMNRAGKTNKQIMDELNIGKSTLEKYFICIRKSGFLVQNNEEPIIRVKNKPRYYEKTAPASKRVYVPKAPQKPVKEREPVKPTLEDGKTVNCTNAVSKKCVYGCDNFSSGTCRYILCIGHKRPCPASECNVFSKRSRQNPKLKALGE